MATCKCHAYTDTPAGYAAHATSIAKWKCVVHNMELPILPGDTRPRELICAFGMLEDKLDDIKAAVERIV